MRNDNKTGAHLQRCPQPPVVAYADQCLGRPALVTTTSSYATAFVNKVNSVVLLYKIENLDPQNINRVVLPAGNASLTPP
jgi:hypothetical protein